MHTHFYFFIFSTFFIFWAGPNSTHMGWAGPSQLGWAKEEEARVK